MEMASFLGQIQKLVLSDFRGCHHHVLDSCAAISTVFNHNPNVRLSCSDLMVCESLTTIELLCQEAGCRGGDRSGFQCEGLVASKICELFSYTEESSE